MKLHTSGEDYLEAVLVLSREKDTVRAVDLSQHLGVSKPSVSRAVSLLKSGGFLEVKNNHLYLTEAGREVAEKIYERHCFFKSRLVGAGVDEHTAEREACLLEHTLSDDSFAKLKRAAEGKKG